jgi:hypothetical protein
VSGKDWEEYSGTVKREAATTSILMEYSIFINLRRL